MKKLMLVILLMVLSMSFVAGEGYETFIVLEATTNTADPMDGIDFTVEAFNEDYEIESIKLYENGVLIPDGETDDCDSNSPHTCYLGLNDHTPATGVSSVTYIARAYIKEFPEWSHEESNEIVYQLSPIITNVNVPTATLTEDSAVITWDTDKDATSVVRYGTDPGDYVDDEINSAYVLSHSITLIGLTEGETYYFIVESIDEYDNLAVSGEYDFTPLDVTAPEITNLQVVNVEPTQATITWETDDPADSRVNYGTVTGVYTDTDYDSNLVLSHSITLTGLTSGVDYYFVVESIDASSIPQTSAEQTFIPLDVSGPVMSNVNSNVDTTVTPLEVTIVWETDENCDGLVRYGTTSGYYPNAQSDTVIDSQTHSVTLIGLADDDTYYYVLEGTDIDGNLGRSAEFSFEVPDLTAPIITNVREENVYLTSANIKWNTDELADSKVSYGVLPGVYGTEVSDSTYVTGHDILLDNLEDGITYYYVVESTDEYGNTEVLGAERSFTTGKIVLTFREPDEDEEFFIGDVVKGELRIENSDDSDIEVDVEISLYDESDDDEIEDIKYDDKDIDSGDTRDFNFEFDLPKSLDDGNSYQIQAKVRVGGTTYKKEVDIDVERKSQDVKIENMRISVLGKKLEVNLDVVNEGKKDQDDVFVEITVFGLGLGKTSNTFALEDWEGNNRIHRKFVFEMPSDVDEGMYSVEAALHYGSSFDYVTKDFEVRDSVSSSGSIFDVQSYDVIGTSGLVSKSEVDVMKFVTWGIVDFLLLTVVIYGFVWLIKNR